MRAHEENSQPMQMKEEKRAPKPKTSQPSILKQKAMELKRRMVERENAKKKQV